MQESRSLRHNELQMMSQNSKAPKQQDLVYLEGKRVKDKKYKNNLT